MWHKIKNIKKNLEEYLKKQTPLSGSLSKGITLSNAQKEENKIVRSQLADKIKFLGNHFYRACKSKEGRLQLFHKSDLMIYITSTLACHSLFAV